MLHKQLIRGYRVFRALLQINIVKFPTISLFLKSKSPFQGLWLSRFVYSVKNAVLFKAIDACKFLLCCQDCRLKGCLWKIQSFRKFWAVAMDDGTSSDGNGAWTKADFLFYKS